MKCPLCKQPVHTPEPPYEHRRDLTRMRRKMARQLRGMGYSMRQIQAVIGWRSVRSVQTALGPKE